MKLKLTPEIEALIDELAALAEPGDTPESLIVCNLRGSIQGQRDYLEEVAKQGRAAERILRGKPSLAVQR